MASPTTWRSYLTAFHHERAGITEDVLEHAFDKNHRTPYDWAAELVVPGSTVLDLACGSGPMRDRLPSRSYLGIDLSAAELTAFPSRSSNVIRADAAALPLADDVVDAVVMSMALMLVPLQATLREVKRVLHPGGLFVATMPAIRPMPAGDWLRYARLCFALRQPGLSYPNDMGLANAAAPLQDAGLTLEDEEWRAFSCRIETEHLADQLLASMYLKDVDPWRRAAGRKVVRRWVGHPITTPIRRLVARA